MEQGDDTKTSVIRFQFSSAEEMEAAESIILQALITLLDHFNEQRKEYSKISEIRLPVSEFDEKNLCWNFDPGSPFDLKKLQDCIDEIKSKLFYESAHEQELTYDKGATSETKIVFYFRNDKEIKVVANMIISLALLHAPKTFINDFMTVYTQKDVKDGDNPMIVLDRDIFDIIKQAEVGIRLRNPNDNQEKRGR